MNTSVGLTGQPRPEQSSAEMPQQAWQPSVNPSHLAEPFLIVALISLPLRPEPSTNSPWLHSKGWRLSSRGEEKGLQSLWDLCPFAQLYSHPHLPSKLILHVGKRLDNRLKPILPQCANLTIGELMRES